MSATSPTGMRRHFRAGAVNPIAAAPMACLLVLALGACADPGPAGPSGDPPRTTPVDRVVIGAGVFTARLEEPFVNRFGFTLTPIALHIRNISFAPLAGRFDLTPGCHYWVRIYRTSARDVVAGPDPSRQGEAICTADIKGFEVGPRGKVLIPNAGALVAESYLGDSLPDGWYHPTVTIAPFGVLAELKVDSVHLVRR